MYDERPPWLMSLEHAERIERAALEREIDVEVVVDHVLTGIGEPWETLLLKKKLMKQLRWLLKGKPEETAPWVIEYEQTGENPFSFRRWLDFEHQVDCSIDRFVYKHLPRISGMIPATRFV